MDGFDIRVAEPDGDCVLYVQGDVDVATARELKNELAIATAGRAKSVRVDFDAVPFLDSTGIRVLLEAVVLLERSGRLLYVSRPSPQAARTIELCHVTDRLHVLDIDATPDATPDATTFW